ncbi:MAG: N-ethylammeline chlorohydrolase [Alphaproteobacteria bacterium]|nr:N-ethylammeline chlorohydrolase [Alphaproteobacteria bacterium]
MARTTRIKKASWVVAWDEAAKRHKYVRDADLVFAGNTIVHVGKDYRGNAEVEIDGTDLVLLPGFIDLHSHPGLEPIYKGIREEHGVPEMYMSGLYERMQAFVPDNEGMAAGSEIAYAELLKSGVTTLVDLMFPFPGWIELLAKSGLRGYAGPWYSSASWNLINNFELRNKWDEQAGRRSFERALQIMDEAEKHPSGRLRGIHCAGTIDTVSADLLRDGIAHARSHKMPFTTHAAQSVLEFHEMTKRNGKTSIQWAESLGILGPQTIIGHGMIIDEHSWVHWHTKRDVPILAATGTTVAHCPTPFSRYGQIMEDFGRYVRSGINMGLGTDTFPHNMIEEIRTAAVFARIAAEDINTLTIADVFHAATIGGATALGRDDLGRLAPGARADIVVVDGAHVDMRPLRDPLRSLIFAAADRAVRDVYVDGVQVVGAGTVLTLDPNRAADRLTESQARMERETPARDWAKRRAIDIVPLSLPVE